MRDLRQHKEQPDFLFCWWKSKFPLGCSPEQGHTAWLGCTWVCESRTLLQGVLGVSEVGLGLVGGLDWWEAAGFTWWCCWSFPTPRAHRWAPAGSRQGHLGAALVVAALSWVLRTPRERWPFALKEGTLRTTWSPSPHVPTLSPCRTVAMAAAGTRSACPALPGSSRTAGDTTAASPACPVPSSTACRNPTAQPRPMPSAGSACRGERGQHGHTWGRQGGAGHRGHPGSHMAPKRSLVTQWCLCEDAADGMEVRPIWWVPREGNLKAHVNEL